ncbi:MAG: hypothetical protein IPM03_00925 [Sulfuritalea sp.]|nr:hypothetical protein [Sulfuritalea sp.]
MKQQVIHFLFHQGFQRPHLGQHQPLNLNVVTGSKGRSPAIHRTFTWTSFDTNLSAGHSTRVGARGTAMDEWRSGRAKAGRSDYSLTVAITAGFGAFPANH